MPQLNHTFTSGRMNKDLDERLVPNGEYTDALNIQIGHSEGSDVGAIENLLGNTAQSALGLTNATVIGSIRHNSTNCIYWFFTADGVDCIAEYNQTTDTVSPVIVDKNSVLNFSASYLITAINIIDNLLFWTDDNSEPKKINLDTFKTGSTNFSTHTPVYGSAFVAADVNVIKRGPRLAPTHVSRTTRKSGSEVGCGINEVGILYDFTVSRSATNATFDYSVMDDGVSVTLVTSIGVVPNWAVGDVISMKASRVGDNNYIDEFGVRVKITAVAVTTFSTITATILTISPDIDNTTYNWQALLEEAPPMFEFQMPRFSLRWKYADGEYSPFGPFSDIAFIPTTFGYSSKDAYNNGMVNHIRKLSITNAETLPKEVVEVDFLFKDNNSNLVYKLDTVPAATTLYEVKSRLVSAVIEANQLLRPWDNVPVKAKAQEITGNRVLYGNYLQGNNMVQAGGSAFYPSITAGIATLTHGTIGEPKESIKSERDYQLGIVYSDNDGRESPVFTSSAATITNPKSNADKRGSLTAQSTAQVPHWATRFKYFIKETSGEYYNVALDRFYKAADGNMWISAPSSERNKVSEDGFLSLKKQHDSETPVLEEARYKVLAIENEAPDDVKYSRSQYSTVLTTVLETFRPTVGKKEFRFKGPSSTANAKFFSAIEAGSLVRIKTTTNISGYYEIAGGGPNGDVYGSDLGYTIELDTPFLRGDKWINDLISTETMTVVIYKAVLRETASFTSKFFIKIPHDPVFEQAIIKPLVEKSPSYIDTSSAFINDVLPAMDDRDTSAINSYEQPSFGYAETPDNITGGAATTNLLAPANGSTLMGIGYAHHSAEHNGTNFVDTPVGEAWFDAGLIPGNFVKFNKDTARVYYQIATVVTNTRKRVSSGNFLEPNVIVTKYVTFTSQLALTGNYDINNFHVYYREEEYSSLFTEGVSFLSSPTPAIFETEPKEQIELDIYYEATNSFPISEHSDLKTLDWFNCYSFGNGVESDRIRDDYNAPRIGKGVKVSAPLDEPYSQERKSTGLIFSGIYNSTSGVNKLNQFAMAEPITKDLNPTYGSIQKLHTRDTDTIVLCEDKILRVLSNKDALYNADGNANITSNRAVLGQTVPFVGEFGISKNPESFASYGFRAYFSDQSRGVILRLSRDGLTEISANGMSNFFIVNLSAATTVLGSFDDQTNCYNITLNGKTASFKENVRGWPTLKSFVPESGLSLNNVYYTFKDGELWSHDNAARNTFYGGSLATSTVTFLINDAPSNIKNFQTIAYEGTSGWTTPSIETDQQSGRVMSFVEKEGLWYNHIKGLDTTWNNATSAGSLDTKEFSVQGLGTVGDVEQTTGFVTMEMNADINVSLQAGAGDVIFFQTNGTDTVKKIGECTAISGSQVTCAHTAGQPVPVADTDYIFFAKNSEVNTSGIVGYYARTKMQVTSTSMKELFAVNSETFISS